MNNFGQSESQPEDRELIEALLEFKRAMLLLELEYQIDELIMLLGGGMDGGSQSFGMGGGGFTLGDWNGDQVFGNYGRGFDDEYNLGELPISDTDSKSQLRAKDSAALHALTNKWLREGYDPNNHDEYEAICRTAHDLVDLGLETAPCCHGDNPSCRMNNEMQRYRAHLEELRSTNGDTDTAC